MIRNETLYNLTLESPLLRDADILDVRIMETWRDAIIRRAREINEEVLRRVRGAEEVLGRAGGELERVGVLESEGEALGTLGDNVL
jgi:hypothetical protein